MRRLDLALYLLAFLLALASTISYLALVAFKLDFSYNFWVAVTSLGSTEFYLAVLPIVYHSLPRTGAMGLALSLLVTATITGIVKDIAKLPRPPPEMWRVGAEGYGFPSGHASGSTAFWGYLSIYRPLAPLVAFSAVMIASVSISRLVLGVHYPRDVAGGVLLGVTVASLSYLASRFARESSLAMTAFLVGLAGVTLSYLGLGDFRPSSALIGIAFGELACGKLRLVSSVGWAYGVTGSIVALIFGLAALKVEVTVASAALMILAGFLAVVTPRLLRLRFGGLR